MIKLRMMIRKTVWRFRQQASPAATVFGWST
jgi:hypothetical protein